MNPKFHLLEVKLFFSTFSKSKGTKIVVDLIENVPQGAMPQKEDRLIYEIVAWTIILSQNWVRNKHFPNFLITWLIIEIAPRGALP